MIMSFLGILEEDSWIVDHDILQKSKHVDKDWMKLLRTILRLTSGPDDWDFLGGLKFWIVVGGRPEPASLQEMCYI